MNETQIKVLAAFNVTMQEFTNLWQSDDPRISDNQRVMAYGGASAMLLLARTTTDVRELADHAATLLNQAAAQLGLPQTN